MGRGNVKLPCYTICNELRSHWQPRVSRVNRIHLTCLTCPLRRYHYQNEQSGFIKLQEVTILAESAVHPYTTVPVQRFLTYFLTVKLNHHLNGVKLFFVRFLLVLAQKIAKWHVKTNGYKSHAVFMLQSKAGMVFPREFKAYFIFLPQQTKGTHWFYFRIKGYFVKWFLTVAERIGEW